MDKKILATLVALLILTAVVGVGVYQNVEQLMNRTPTATVAARQAVEAHDLATFQKFVDVDALIEQAAAEIRHQVAAAKGCCSLQCGSNRGRAPTAAPLEQAAACFRYMNAAADESGLSPRQQIAVGRADQLCG